jgi:NPCBM/NEW2 domain
VVLVIVGLVILPSASSTEKALIIGACAALSTAGVTGVNAWRSTGRFIATATAGAVTIVCLGGLSITASRASYDQPHTTGNAQSPPASTDRGQAASASPGRSSALASPVPMESASKTPGTKTSPLYLAGLVGTTDQAGIQSVAPEPGQWRMAGILYPHSLGYSGTSALCALQQSVTYQIPSSYQDFIATVGVFDIPSDPQGQGDAVDFQVDNGSGTQLGAQTAQYGEPAVIDVRVQGVTSLTLITSSTVGCFGDNSTEAVWGNARLVPGS